MKKKPNNTSQNEVSVGDFVFLDSYQNYGIVREIIPNEFYGEGRWEGNYFKFPTEPMYVVKIYDSSTGRPFDCPDKRHSESDIKQCPICSRNLRLKEFRKLNKDEYNLYLQEGMIK